MNNHIKTAKESFGVEQTGRRRRDEYVDGSLYAFHWKVSIHQNKLGGFNGKYNTG